MSNIKYTKEEIFSTLQELVKVININDIKTMDIVKDFMPDYQGKMADWKVGEFLRNARSGQYLSYRPFLVELGFELHRESLISRIARICDAIDLLVEKGVDLETIPKYAMMSEYDKSYEWIDLPIGRTLANARYGRVGDIITNKLKEHNFSFKTQAYLHEDKIKQLIKDVARVVDLNTIPNKAVVGDYLPDYDKAFIDYKIGLLIQNIRAGSYKFLEPVLQELGFNITNIRKRNSAEYICDAIDKLVEIGIDLNTIPIAAMMSDYIPSYKENDIKMGVLMQHARINKTGELVTQKLTEYNFDFDRSRNKKLEMKKVIVQVAGVTDINKIKCGEKVSTFLPNYNGILKDWNIGAFLAEQVKKGNSEFEEVLNDVGFAWNKRTLRHYSDEFIFKALKDLNNIGVDLNSVSLRTRMSFYIPSYADNDLPIGVLLSRARMEQLPDTINDELKKYNFDFKRKILYISTEEKLDILKKLISNGVDINKIRGSEKLSGYIDLNEDEADYPIGIWLSKARQGRCDKEFLKGLKDLNYKRIEQKGF